MRRILVSAYGCEPFRGSEAGVGWNWVLQMAKENELFVVTRANDREKIEQNIPQELHNNLHFFYYDTCELLRKVKNKEKGLYLYYWFWQIGIIPIVKNIILDYKPDYTMHLSFGSLWMPTFLPFFKVPFIWGPIGGGDGVPKSYLKIFPWKQRIVQGMRYVLIALASINPLVFIPSKRAVAILCRTKNNANAIPKRYRDKCRVVLETAMTNDVFSVGERKYNNNATIKLISTGRLVPFKNIIMGIETVNCLISKGYNIEYTIVGKGPEERKIRNLIKKYQIENRVHLLGEKTREEVLEYLEKANIYMFPSLREGGSWALMEAMASGIPVVCFDWTGTGVITDDYCANRIKPTDLTKDISQFVNATKDLLDNPEKREKYGLHGKQRIKEIYCWEEKGRFMKNLFEELERKRNGD